MVELDGDLARVRREDVVGLLQELVRVPSVTDEEGAVGEVVQCRMGCVGTLTFMEEPWRAFSILPRVARTARDG